MSSTSLVRSSSTSLTPSSSTAQKKAVSPAATSTTSLPKLNLTPRQSPGTPAQRPTPGSAPGGRSTPSQKPATAAPSPAAASPANSTPGRWRHPRMDEVIRRQNRTNFDRRNTIAITLSAVCLALSFMASGAQSQYLPTDLQTTINPYTTYIHLALRVFFTAIIALSMLPLLRKPDTCEDIPLTPHQRQLMGLPPMTRQATAQEQAQYVTPPRYARSPAAANGTSTPGSGSSSLFVQASGSPLAGYGNNTGAAGSPLSATASPYASGSQQQQQQQRGSPYALSPIGVAGERRRVSFTSARGSPGSLNEIDAAGFGGEGSVRRSSIGTPSKGQHRASVGLNSKWLYEKGRTSSGWGTWGTGSVFN